MELHSEVITKENALMLVRKIKESTDDEGCKLIATIIDAAQEKIVQVVRELTRKKAN